MRIRVTVTIVALFLLMTGMFTMGSSADTLNYPAPQIDPSTGSVYDLGGKTVYIYDYWTSSDWHNQTLSSDADIATYSYRQWIEDTYNCKVAQKQKGDWGTCAEELINYAKNPDGKLCVFIIEPGKIAQVISSGLVAGWNESSSVNINDQNWTKSTVELTTVKERTYGVAFGVSEPTICLYFNKRVLTDAGVDWNEIYDMQAAGTWTWNKFENILKKVHGDTNGDGVFDTYGLAGSSDDLKRMAVFSNGGSFFDYDANGNLTTTADSEATKTALEWARGIWSKYARKQRESDNWDYYKDVWKEGHVAFYIYRTYGGFSSYSEMADMEDPWGCVAFPKGNPEQSYVSIISNNTAFIPNVYTQSDLSKITLIYELWNSPTPGVVEDNLARFEGLTDERAIYETYALLSDPTIFTEDKTSLLGTINDILGMNLLWQPDEEDLDTLLETAKENWKEKLEEFNNLIYNIPNTPVNKNALVLPEGLQVIGEQAFEGIDAEIIIIPDSCVSIGSRAFANIPQLKTVHIPKNIFHVADDAFEGSDPEIVWE